MNTSRRLLFSFLVGLAAVVGICHGGTEAQSETTFQMRGGGESAASIGRESEKEKCAAVTAPVFSQLATIEAPKAILIGVILLIGCFVVRWHKRTFRALAILALLPIALCAQTNDLLPGVSAPEEFDLAAFIAGIVTAFPKLSALILGMGACRLLLKPVVSFVQWWVASSATKRDDEILQRVGRSNTWKVFWALANYVASVKPIDKSAAASAPVIASVRAGIVNGLAATPAK